MFKYNFFYDTQNFDKRKETMTRRSCACLSTTALLFAMMCPVLTEKAIAQDQVNISRPMYVVMRTFGTSYSTSDDRSPEA